MQQTSSQQRASAFEANSVALRLQGRTLVIAILRSRLWEIDIIINRSLV